MGIFWDLLQEDELEKQQKQANSLEDRIEILEKELTNTKELLKKTLIALEKHISQDIDGDGKLG
jgi:DNA-binding protein H-NS